MQICTVHKGDELVFTVEPLSEAYLDTAAELCDRCVGVNLYPKTYLSSVIHQPDHYFYLFLTAGGETAGYLYYFLTDVKEMAEFAKLSVEKMAEVSPKKDPVIAHFRSIGVAEDFRNLGLSDAIVHFFFQDLDAHARADVAVGIGWKIHGYVPMDKTVRSAGFHHLTDAHRVWYDNEDLICPYCKGRCECDAAIYYKPLEREP